MKSSMESAETQNSLRLAHMTFSVASVVQVSKTN